MFRKLLDRLLGKRPPVRPPIDLAAPAPAGPGKPRAVEEWEAAARQEINREARPEELCGISPEMDRREMGAHLARLYRRHNRAAASLDPKLREEAEVMLNAIVVCRQRYLEAKRSG